MNIITAGVAMATYLFCVIVAYFLLSTPVDLIFSGFDDADTGAAAEYLDVHIASMRTIFQMFFAMMAAVAPAWFIFWIFHREPQWGYNQY